nr:hypothetical protein [Caldimonas brevitalea]
MKARSALVVLFLAGAAGVAGATDVGVSVSVSQPGLYGRIDIGHAPPPPVIYAQPVIIQRPRVAPQPIYMHVPPGHAKNWGKHCRKYDACGTPVYFVKDYDRYRQHHGGHHHHHHRDRDHDRDHDRGHGRGGDDHGRGGHDHGHHGHKHGHHKHGHHKHD